MHDASLHALVGAIKAHPALQHALDQAPSVPPLALPEAVQAAVVAAIAGAVQRPIVWLVAEADEARAHHDALRALAAPGAAVHVMPAPDALPFERLPWDPATREARIAALLALQSWRAGTVAQAPIIVAPMRGVLTRTLPAARLDADVQVVRPEQDIPVTELVRRLFRLGYARTGRVAAPGEMALRGGILDVFPPSEATAVRLEWFGDVLESIRTIDVTSQRSVGALDAVILGPAAEALPDGGPLAAAALDTIDWSRLHPVAESEIRRHVEHLARGERFAGIDAYASLLYAAPATLLDHLPDDGWIVCHDLARVRLAAETAIAQAGAVRDEMIGAGELPHDWPAEPLAGWVAVERAWEARPHVALGRPSHADAPEGALGEAFGGPPLYANRTDDAVADIALRAERGEAVTVISRQAPRLAELLAEIGPATAAGEVLPSVPGGGGIALVHEALGSGFTFQAPGAPLLVVLTDRELFGWRQPMRRRAERTATDSNRPDFFAELSEGDHVVHIEHGIGVFRGLLRMTVGGIERDYLQLDYAAGDTLYVPTHQSDRIARYVGTGEITPAVSRLGTADWERAKAKARREIEDIAADLLVLYARRETARRNPFAADGAWQAEMEAAFPFHETDDQLRAIEDVKRDMESVRPMDRLVVGDVGFGKTEVALRAAFKAVNDGRQVAVLAPTTVLAQQHHETFARRLGPFPVRIESLSRFRKRAEQAVILDSLAKGEVDVIIGTHRLLSMDVRFRDLGLLIVDEEHRFGVKHKERLRELAEGVDTLTLTATPIPRTMHLALTGLRDLTTIDTPPSERLPVATHVGPFDESLVRTAIRRELDRSGQVFYVYNRVQGIEMIAQKVMRLVPEARVVIAHGQLGEGALAEAMLAFVAGTVDVLVCTSIIESGLDIPNANTLVVERADRFGLAQLHQLRGRVGRSAQRAYAYFLHPIGGEMDDGARERLAALADDTSLGAGMRIALRDLELRGAGEILGARQHGHVAAIGLDLYTRLLAEAVKRVRADAEEPAPVPERVERELAAIDPGALPTVDLPLDAYLPEEYVPGTQERTRVYRRMAAADDEAAVREIELELRDRFGRPPAPVRHLLIVLRLRVLAHLAGASSIGREGTVVAMRWPEARPVDRARLIAALGKDAIVGQHRVAIPFEGPPERWLPHVQRLVQAAVDVARAPVGA